MAKAPTTVMRPVERCLEILSDRWTFLIIRDALMAGVERFADFEKSLGIATNMLTARLEHLVDSGVMVKRSYQEPGSRRRQSYHLTQAGRDLALPFAALQQWADEHEPHPNGPSVERRSPSGQAVRVELLDEGDHSLRADDMTFVPSAWKAALIANDD